MPRGVKKIRNIPEEIAVVGEQIAKHESAIKTLKAKLSALQEEQEQSELRNLNNLLKQSGISTQELMNMIDKSDQEDIA